MQASVPDHIKEKQNDILFDKIMLTEEEAKAVFHRAYHRIADPLSWHQLTNLAVARFWEPEDRTINRIPLICEGNYLRIQIPGSGSDTGDSYDWVKIDRIIQDKNSEKAYETFGMTFRACSNPEHSAQMSAHFFQSLATSTFLIRRYSNTVVSSYHGRYEDININAISPMANIRNAFVAVGSKVGLSETEWSKLVKSFLAD